MKTISILLVEDDFLNRRLVKKGLCEDSQYHILEAKNSQEALALLAKGNIDLIILDINLGEKEQDGISLGQHIKEKYAIPFIYLTAYETADIIKKAIITTPLAYLTKPFKKADLVASIALAIQNNKEPQEDKPYLLVKEDDYTIKINMEQIDYIESEGNYLLVSSNHKVYKYRSTIKQILEILPAARFIQTHRAFIVNKDKIDMLTSKNLIIKKYAIPVSKNYRNNTRSIYELPNNNTPDI